MMISNLKSTSERNNNPIDVVTEKTRASWEPLDSKCSPERFGLKKHYEHTTSLLRTPLHIRRIVRNTISVSTEDDLTKFIEKDLKEILEMGRLDLAEVLAQSLYRVVCHKMNDKLSDLFIELRGKYDFLDQLVKKDIPPRELFYRLINILGTGESMEKYSSLWIPVLNQVMGEKAAMIPAIAMGLPFLDRSRVTVHENLYFITLIPALYDMNSEQAREFYHCLARHGSKWTKSCEISEHFIARALDTMKHIYSIKESDVFALRVCAEHLSNGYASRGIASNSACLQAVEHCIQSDDLSSAVTLFIEASKQSFYFGCGSDLHSDLMDVMKKIIDRADSDINKDVLNRLFEEILFNCFDMHMEFSILKVMKLIRNKLGIDQMHFILINVLKRTSHKNAEDSKSRINNLCSRSLGSDIDEKSLNILSNDVNYGVHVQEVIKSDKDHMQALDIIERLNNIRIKLTNKQQLMSVENTLLESVISVIEADQISERMKPSTNSDSYEVSLSTAASESGVVLEESSSEDVGLGQFINSFTARELNYFEKKFLGTSSNISFEDKMAELKSCIPNAPEHQGDLLDSEDVDLDHFIDCINVHVLEIFKKEFLRASSNISIDEKKTILKRCIQNVPVYQGDLLYKLGFMMIKKGINIQEIDSTNRTNTKRKERRQSIHPYGLRSRK